MTPLVQRGLAVALVVVAVAYLAWRGWRMWRTAASMRRSAGCGPGCGCG
jgi:threonine/homoserine/homoserine lactone efflux protein